MWSRRAGLGAKAARIVDGQRRGGQLYHAVPRAKIQHVSQVEGAARKKKEAEKAEAIKKKEEADKAARRRRADLENAHAPLQG